MKVEGDRLFNSIPMRKLDKNDEDNKKQNKRMMMKKSITILKADLMTIWKEYEYINFTLMIFRKILRIYN